MTSARIIAGKINVADYLTKQVKERPYNKAVITPEGSDSRGRGLYKSVTFKQLEGLVDGYAWAFTNAGIQFGDRVLIGTEPGVKLVAITFALFKMGAVPVFIDPGMGKDHLLHCVSNVRARALIGNFKANIMAYLAKEAFKGVEIFINVDRFQFGRIKSLYQLPSSDQPFPITETSDSDKAAILFTSGSTGPAKGVVYTHGIFSNQIEMIKDAYQITDKDTDMSIFPLFGLFAVSMGMCTVIPDMDTSKPAQVDPCKILRIMNDHGITFSFGSPTFWRIMADFCEAQNTQLPMLRAILMAGCSVPADLHKRFIGGILNADANIYVPYGATESLPVCSFTGTEVLDLTEELSNKGAGTCVGSLVSEFTEVKILRISDEAIAEWDESLVLKADEVGEIIVTGPTVTKAYFDAPEANEKSKIKDGDKIWHRIGDVGYLDQENRLWFCGRKNDRVQLKEQELYTDQCENIFNTHDEVSRSALVGVDNKGQKEAVIIIEVTEPNKIKSSEWKQDITQQLLLLAKKYPTTENIKHIMFKDSFPVDVRHNAKIKREILTVWAQEQL